MITMFHQTCLQQHSIYIYCDVQYIYIYIYTTHHVLYSVPLTLCRRICICTANRYKSETVQCRSIIFGDTGQCSVNFVIAVTQLQFTMCILYSVQCIHSVYVVQVVFHAWQRIHHNIETITLKTATENNFYWFQIQIIWVQFGQETSQIAGGGGYNYHKFFEHLLSKGLS